MSLAAYTPIPVPNYPAMSQSPTRTNCTTAARGKELKLLQHPFNVNQTIIDGNKFAFRY